MKRNRKDISLCGVPSQLFAVGGEAKTGEKYRIARNKWTELAPLYQARELPGCVVLNDLTAFCFCGYSEPTLNTIERY